MYEVGKVYKNMDGLDVAIIAKIPTNRHGFLFEGVIINNREYNHAAYLFDEEGNVIDHTSDDEFSLEKLDSN